MPEHLRALVVILFLSGLVFFLARPVMIQIIPESTFSRWRRLWFFTSVVWFLAFSFWVYALVMAFALTLARKKEDQVLGLYFLLLMAAPAIAVPIPAFGLIDHLFPLDHYRLLALTLLLPAALALMRLPGTIRFGRSPVDWFFLGFLALTWLMSLQDTSLTNWFRMGFLHYIDAILPYYVISRGIRDEHDFRQLMAALLLGGLLLAAFAMFEAIKGWKLYNASITNFGMFIVDAYKTRGPFLRPGVVLLDSIVLGTVLVLATGALLYLKTFIRSRFRYFLLLVFLCTGVLMSLSRAPWIAALLLFLLIAFQGEKAARDLMGVLMAFVSVLLLLYFLPGGHLILDLLPFFGKMEQGSVDYRMDWFSASLPLIERNFWFGDVRALQAPELEVMRQGEGVVDLVNTFLAVLLYYGFVGFVLFVGMFFSAVISVRKGLRARTEFARNEHRLGRVLVASVVVLAFILITVSMISILPTLIWLFLGLCSAYGLLAWRLPREAALGR
jgi:hypothetical protein